MSPDTAPDIRALLDEAPTPDHGDGFWAALHGDLATGGDGASVRLAGAGSGRRGPGRWLLSVAAVALVAVGAAVFLTTRDDGAVPVTSDPTTTTTEATAPAGPLRVDGEPMVLDGTHVVDVSPDSRWLYVTGPHPAGGQGCEGQLRRALFVQSTDGGERRLVGNPDQAIDATGATRMAFGPEGSVAALTICESSVSEFVAGTLGAGGEIADPVDLDADDFASIVDVEWSSAGSLLVTTYGLGAETRDGRALIEITIGPEGPAMRTLPPAGLLAIDQLADGTLVSRDDVGTVRVGNEEIGSEGQIFDLAVSPDDQVVVTAAEGGVTAYDLATGASEQVSDLAAHDVEFLDSGDLVVETRDDRSVVRVESVRLGPIGSAAHERATLFEMEALGTFVTAVPSPDGSRIWISYRDHDEALVLLDQRLTR